MVSHFHKTHLRTIQRHLSPPTIRDLLLIHPSGSLESERVPKSIVAHLLKETFPLFAVAAVNDSYQSQMDTEQIVITGERMWSINHQVIAHFPKRFPSADNTPLPVVTTKRSGLWRATRAVEFQTRMSENVTHVPGWG